MARITDIPTELVRKIVRLADLPLRNLDALRQISRAFNHLILNDPLFWAHLHFSELPPFMLGPLLARSGDVPVSVSVVIHNRHDYLPAAQEPAKPLGHLLLQTGYAKRLQGQTIGQTNAIIQEQVYAQEITDCRGRLTGSEER
ncbi:hypothetical protein EXIGLDRAFT_704868 [Exidia glandulosa HHB12029]|uniref:F-box domain-containing protein n=1 Tax=Exidia glandulosa HHB12029 TaxID=1314781 RepID=A0A165BIE4_EXIGL|nr:hypothetical protein EXIGLDRAFT_704868 [Exidia glandulosa HHB12029]